jgi:hypothetical protein
VSRLKARRASDANRILQMRGEGMTAIANVTKIIDASRDAAWAAIAVAKRDGASLRVSRLWSRSLGETPDGLMTRLRDDALSRYAHSLIFVWPSPRRLSLHSHCSRAPGKGRARRSGELQKTRLSSNISGVA